MRENAVKHGRDEGGAKRKSGCSKFVVYHCVARDPYHVCIRVMPDFLESVVFIHVPLLLDSRCEMRAPHFFQAWAEGDAHTHKTQSTEGHDERALRASLVSRQQRAGGEEQRVLQGVLYHGRHRERPPREIRLAPVRDDKRGTASLDPLPLQVPRGRPSHLFLSLSLSSLPM